MTHIGDYVFEINGQQFGYGNHAIHLYENGFHPEGGSVEGQEVLQNITDSYAFGVDKTLPGVWAWEIYTQSESPEQAVAALAPLGRIWADYVGRRTSGKVLELKYGLAGRTRSIFGRPRRWSQTLDNGVLSGLIPVDMDFQRADNLYYGAEVSSAQFRSTPQIPLGIVSPLVSPITGLEQTEPTAGVAPPADGDVPSPFEAVITGPIVNPWIHGYGWELEILTDLPAGMSITISTYPWGYRVRRSDGANLSGMLGPKSRLSKARIPVSGDTITYGGIDTVGTSTCTIHWRPAYLNL